MLATSRTFIGKAFKPRLPVRWASYEGDGKTTVSVLNKDRGDRLLVDSYSRAGFRMNNGLFIFGPIALFPKSVLQWKVKTPYDITEEAFSLFTLLEPKIDVLQKYFDSGDYNMAKAKGLSPEKAAAMSPKPTGDVIPTVESLPPRHAPRVKSKLVAEPSS
ncbi:hypothetical protein HPB52_010622 [Rhipicephalus sanguineus]|uniref:Uncharacterized protein n=1 Tax=Rhipicephalus sanguineus TaxID=34632 RepID=A0A9D4YN66_RHISA|nr:hypothetical protein HPB52_010622 [Rhipicephalus sanguineus]